MGLAENSVLGSSKNTQLQLSNVNIFDLIILLGAVQGLLFSVFLFVRPAANRKATLFLGIFLFGFSVNSMFNSFEGLGFRTGQMNTLIEYLPLFCSTLIIAAFHFSLCF